MSKYQKFSVFAVLKIKKPQFIHGFFYDPRMMCPQFVGHIDLSN